MRHALAALTLAVVLAAPLAHAVEAASAVCAPAALHLVRHAEKADAAGDPDPVLSAAGQSRAQALVTWAEGRRIDAVYATHLRRTQHTAAPLAAARDLELRVLPANGSARLLQRLREHHCGEHVVVVGHSNTVPELAQAFGAPAFAIGDDEFGWVYSLAPPDAALQRERYGAAP